MIISTSKTIINLLAWGNCFLSKWDFTSTESEKLSDKQVKPILTRVNNIMFVMLPFRQLILDPDAVK